MDCTDVHYRQLARLISRRTWLWTEMVVDGTILHAHGLERFLWFPPEQRPLVLQLGGSQPELLRAAAAAAAPYGYDEVNLNCGCPSDRCVTCCVSRGVCVHGAVPQRQVLGTGCALQAQRAHGQLPAVRAAPSARAALSAHGRAACCVLHAHACMRAGSRGQAALVRR
jgi:tRNA-dihydrouridine synthase A